MQNLKPRNWVAAIGFAEGRMSLYAIDGVSPNWYWKERFGAMKLIWAPFQHDSEQT